MAKPITNRQKKAQETKKAIFESAITLFKEKGFENVYIDEITSKAGTSKGSFYTYFKSKDEVIIEHYKKFDEHYESVVSALPIHIDTKIKLLTILKEGLIFAEKLGYEFLSIVLYNQLSKEELSIVMNKDRNIYKFVLQLIEEGKEKGEIDLETDSEELAEMLLCYYKGLYLDWCFMKGTFPFVEKGEKQLKVFIDKVLGT